MLSNWARSPKIFGMGVNGCQQIPVLIQNILEVGLEWYHQRSGRSFRLVDDGRTDGIYDW